MRRRWLIFFASCLLAGALRADEQVIYPRVPAASPAVPVTHDAGGNSWLLPVVVLAAAAGGWLLWRQRRLQAGPGGAGRKLVVSETKPLGNRQYLVVADYDGQRFLLGVCPGRIEMLSALQDGDKSPGQNA